MLIYPPTMWPPASLSLISSLKSIRAHWSVASAWINKTCCLVLLLTCAHTKKADTTRPHIALLYTNMLLKMAKVCCNCLMNGFHYSKDEIHMYSNKAVQHNDSHTFGFIHYPAPKWHSELHICYLGQRERENSAFPAERTESFCLFPILLSARFGMAILG